MKSSLVHYTERRLQIPLTSSLLMVLYTEISELFCTSFRLALVSKILLKTLEIFCLFFCHLRFLAPSMNHSFTIVCTFLQSTDTKRYIHFWTTCFDLKHVVQKCMYRFVSVDSDFTPTKNLFTFSTIFAVFGQRLK